MAPPPAKPTSPSSSGSDDPMKMTKKKKVTPVQVAFLVERYLADNGFSAALAAFRSDAAHLFSNSKSAAVVPPKGLLPLADILHDYISLKEARLAVDSAMQAMHTLVSTYYSSTPSSSLPPPSSPPLVPPLFVAPSSASSPPQPQPPPPPLPHALPPPGSAGYASPIIHYTHTSSVVVQNSSGANSMSTPAPSSLPTKKRKATRSTTSASKKACTALATTTSHPKGKTVASQQPHDNMASAAQPSSAEHSVMAKLLVQGSTVAKSLFKPQVNSSPCTPQQSRPVRDEPAACQTERPSPVVANAHAQEDIASSKCSIVSSKTVIVSPLKGAAYYAVERSYHVSSPLKQGAQKSSKREHVKGKLDFGSSDARSEPSEQICAKASTSYDGEKKDDFDIDFTDFDMFDGDFSFSELLLDFDLGPEGTNVQNPSTNAEAQRLEPIAKSNYVMTDPALPDSVKPMGVDLTEDIDSQGATSVTSVRAITKRIKIVSPAKGRRAF